MRIAIECLGLIPGKTGGMETYVCNLVQALQAHDSDHEYLLIVGAEARDVFSLPAKAWSSQVAGLSMSGNYRGLGYVRSPLQWLSMMGGLKAWKHDVLHCTTNFPRPAWGARSMIVTIHDIIGEFIPDAIGRVTTRIFNAYAKLGAKIASRVIVDSQFVKRAVIERYGVPEQRVKVVYLGVDRAVFRPAEHSTSEPFTMRFACPEQFLFFPAATFPHKNHLGLFRALVLLRDRYGLTPPLVLTGIRRFAQTKVRSAIGRLGLAKQVHWLGHVNVQELVWCYRAAIATVFPSLHEGFGLPILEAMACGCPVACSNTTAAGEVAGAAAVTFDPEDPEEMAAQLARLLTDDALRRSAREKGTQRAAAFTWEQTARETVRVYEELGRHGHAV